MANGLILKFRSRKYIASNPELKEGYDKLFKGVLIYGNIPWIIMGIGNLTSITRSVFDYFYPRSMNPMVLCFHFSIYILWIYGSRWIYFMNGAEFLERHPGLLHGWPLGRSKYEMSAIQIKIYWALMLLGGVAGVTRMWLQKIPPPFIYSE